MRLVVRERDFPTKLVVASRQCGVAVAATSGVQVLDVLLLKNSMFAKSLVQPVDVTPHSRSTHEEFDETPPF